MTDSLTNTLQPVPTTVVNGFLEAGKTSWIQDTIFHDYYHKRGTTLILVLEEGEAEYDTEQLRSFRTEVAIRPEGCDPVSFCEEAVHRLHPGRVYVEMNAMLSLAQWPDCLKRVFNITLVDYRTLKLYFTNLRQQLQDMVISSDQVVFRCCSELSLLAEWGNTFRLMNRRASYLWESPSGYHEKAFGISVPFDLAQPQLELTEGDYIPFVLDGMASPAHYIGKTLTFLCQADRDGIENAQQFRAGRLVMTCCAADMQSMGFLCRSAADQAPADGSWIRLTAVGEAGPGGFLQLNALKIEPALPPAKLVLTPRQT